MRSCCSDKLIKAKEKKMKNKIYGTATERKNLDFFKIGILLAVRYNVPRIRKLFHLHILAQVFTLSFERTYCSKYIILCHTI